jgi:hypothetical protein
MNPYMTSEKKVVSLRENAAAIDTLNRTQIYLSVSFAFILHNNIWQTDDI